MKYFILAGNHPLQDLLTAQFIKQLRRLDVRAEVTVFGKSTAHDDENEIFRLTSGQEAKKKLKSWNPDVLIFTENTLAHLKIASLARAKNIKTCAYLNGESSVRKLSSLRKTDKILTTLPHENDLLKSKGIQNEYVGNPLLDIVKDYAFSDQLLSDENKVNIAVLAGSRSGRMVKTIRKIVDGTDYQFHIAVENDELSHLFKSLRNVTIHVNKTFELLKYCNAAITMAGDASLKAMFLNCPQVAVYEKKNPFRKHPQWNTLINTVVNKSVVKEISLGRQGEILKEIDQIINDQNYCAGMMADYQELKDRLGHERASYRAANAITDWLESGSS